MANTTIYPYGQGGSLPSSIGIVNDPYTGGADKALSAEVGKELNELLTSMEAARTSGLTEYEAFINYTSPHNWTSGNSNYKCKFLSVNPGDTYYIVGNASRYSYVAVLTSTSHTNATPASLATGCVVERFSGPSYRVITIPSDGKYLYFATVSSGNDCTPASISKVRSNFDIVEYKLTEINSQIIDTSMLAINAGWIIGSNNKWSSQDASQYSSYSVPITPGQDYIVFGGTTGGYCAILASATKVNNQAASFATGYSSRIFVYSGNNFQFTAPDDARYVYLVRMSSGTALDPYLAVPKLIASQVMEIGGGEDEAKRDGFDTAPEYFAWKKMEQATKLVWTPKKATIQKASSTQKFPTSAQQGFPYSSVAEYDKRLGTDVSIHTFMTAINNPYSVMYTECVRYGYSKSAYGITYYGASNCGPYYGMVCSGLEDYSMDMEVPWLTNDLYMDMVTEYGIAELIYDQSANGVKRGDMLCSSGHTRVVKDVWRKNGVVTNVLISESTWPLTIDNAIRTAADFNSYLQTNEIVISRYKELYKNIHYEPSPYVAVGDEIEQTVTYNNDICCFAGDKAAFIEGDLIYIHCLNLDYPQMELYKGDTLVDTITLASDSRSALTSDELCYAVNLSNDSLTYGKYKARLKNNDTYSDYTYFEVINASVTLSDGVATYSSANATAVCWYWQRYHDSEGAKIWDITPLGGQSGTFETSRPSSSYPLLKVLFKGEYGRVAARYLDQ